MRSDQSATDATFELTARISQTKGTVKIVRREIPLETNRVFTKRIKGKAKEETQMQLFAFWCRAVGI